MTLYHEAAFTIDPHVAIPEIRAPAVGMDETGQADELQAFSEGWAPEEKIGYDVVVEGLDLTATLTFAVEPEALDVLWQWGDGTSEPGHDLVQHHQYVLPGTYGVTATVERPDVPSVDLYLSVPVEIAAEPVGP